MKDDEEGQAMERYYVRVELVEIVTDEGTGRSDENTLDATDGRRCSKDDATTIYERVRSLIRTREEGR